MKILVTGSNGFVGRHLKKHLNCLGDDSSPFGNLQPVDAVCHNAALTKTFDVTRDELFHANVTYTQQLFTRLLDLGCVKFIAASSTAVYGNSPTPFREDAPKTPHNDYGDSKSHMEDWCLDFAAKHSVSAVILRYCNVYGPDEGDKGLMASKLYQLVRQMKSGPATLFRDGRQKREWIHVKDVCRANELALTLPTGVYNCATGTPVTFEELVRTINTMLGTDRGVVWSENPYPNYQHTVYCDVTKIRSHGFTPRIDLGCGIRLIA